MITVHVFGLWDSRGGTVAVEADSTQQAMETMAGQLKDQEGVGRIMADAYLGEFTLETAPNNALPDYVAGGVELDCDWDGPGYVFMRADDLTPSQADWHLQGVDWRPEYSSQTRRLLFLDVTDVDYDDEKDEPTAPEGWVTVRWDDDEYSFWWVKAGDTFLDEGEAPTPVEEGDAE